MYQVKANIIKKASKVKSNNIEMLHGFVLNTDDVAGSNTIRSRCSNKLKYLDST